MRPGFSGPSSAAARSRRVASGDAEEELGVGPVVGKGALDPPPLLRQLHRREHKLGLRDQGRWRKVEKSRCEDLLRDFFREMLLIRRFEEKVEERFRAGELPGFLHVAIGQEASPSASAGRSRTAT